MFLKTTEVLKPVISFSLYIYNLCYLNIEIKKHVYLAEVYLDCNNLYIGQNILK